MKPIAVFCAGHACSGSTLVDPPTGDLISPDNGWRRCEDRVRWACSPACLVSSRRFDRVDARVVLGLAPSPNVEWPHSQTFARLVEWSGVERATWLEVPFRNVWPWPHQAGAGRRELEATGRRAAILAELAGRRVLALGSRVTWLLWGLRSTVSASPWQVFPESWCESFLDDGRPRTLSVIAHPSGRNRAYNLVVNRDSVGQLLADWLGLGVP